MMVNNPSICHILPIKPFDGLMVRSSTVMVRLGGGPFPSEALTCGSFVEVSSLRGWGTSR